MAEEFDPFAGSSGLLDDVDVTFTNPQFVKDPQYTDKDTGQMVPVFEATLVGGDEPNRQLFSIGKGWEIQGGGAKVVRAEGPPKGFNNSSYIQLLVRFIIEHAESAARGRYEDTGLSPMDAGYWDGLQLHMKQVETTNFKGELTGKTRLEPTEFLGWGTSSSSAKEEGKAGPAPAKKAAAKKAS